MTIGEAINRINSIKHNTYTNSDKIMWLSNVDSQVKTMIIDTHEGAVTFSGYDDTTDLATELLVPEPFDEMYMRWLEAQIDYSNGEYGKYNNSITMFNTSFEEYAKYYNRTNMPLGKKVKYF